MTGVSNYNSVYENTYALSRKEASKKEETKGTTTTEKNTETAKKSGNKEYLKNLQKQVPYMKLQIGYGLNTNNDGKVNVVDINPKLLEKMQNDPKAAKKYIQRLKDVESALKWLDNYKKSVGSTVIVRHDYIDENGNLSHFSISVRKDKLNEKLHKEAWRNTKEWIQKSREKAYENAEQLAEKSKNTADYVKELAKLVPSVELKIGNAFQTTKSGKTLTINPKLLEKMQNDPEQEKEMKELIKGVESMTKLMDGINKASGWTVVYRHSYIDENGKYREIAYVRNDFMLNMSDKLRKERRKNSEKLIERAKEKAVAKKEELQEMLEEKETIKTREGIGEKEERAEKNTTKEQFQTGVNVDLKI